MIKQIIMLMLLAGIAYGGEYIDTFSTSEPIWIWDFAEAADGTPWVGATCNFTLYYDDGTVYTSGEMTDLGNGLYDYSVGTISTTGYYPLSIVCNKTGNYGMSDRIGFYVKDEYGGISSAKAGQAIALIIIAFTMLVIGAKFKDEYAEGAFKFLFLIMALLITAVALYSISNDVMASGIIILARAVLWIMVIIITLFMVMFIKEIMESISMERI